MQHASTARPLKKSCHRLIDRHDFTFHVTRSKLRRTFFQFQSRYGAKLQIFVSRKLRNSDWFWGDRALWNWSFKERMRQSGTASHPDYGSLVDIYLPSFFTSFAGWRKIGEKNVKAALRPRHRYSLKPCKPVHYDTWIRERTLICWCVLRTILKIQVF